MQLGGDDLLAKPFDLQVLSAKVQALLRRAYDFGPPSHLLACGGAVLNVSDGTLDAAGQRVELTRNELRILQMLLERKGQTVSREALMTRLWESDSFVDENTLTVNVGRSAAEAGGGGAAGADPHPEGRGVSGGGVRHGADLAYLKRQWKLLLLLAGMAAVFAAVFSLYGLPVEAVGLRGGCCAWRWGRCCSGVGFSALPLAATGSCERLLRPGRRSRCCPCRLPRGCIGGGLPGPAAGRSAADRARLLAAENRDQSGGPDRLLLLHPLGPPDQDPHRGGRDCCCRRTRAPSAGSDWRRSF